jgi:hypothetical protein
MYIVVTGDIKTGFLFHGPFDSYDAADEFGQGFAETYEVVELESP